jgi:hypothetical protein
VNACAARPFLQRAACAVFSARPGVCAWGPDYCGCSMFDAVLFCAVFSVARVFFEDLQL